VGAAHDEKKRTIWIAQRDNKKKKRVGSCGRIMKKVGRTFRSWGTMRQKRPKNAMLEEKLVLGEQGKKEESHVALVGGQGHWTKTKRDNQPKYNPEK